MKTLISAGGKRNKIVLSLGTYEGVNTVDIRKYFWDKKAMEYLPTRKGITLTKESFSVVRNALIEFDDEISGWLSPSEKTSQAVLAEQNQHRESAARARYKINRYERHTVDWKSPEFFEAKSEGSIDKIYYNKSNEFVQQIGSLFDLLENETDRTGIKSLTTKLRNMIDLILIGFWRARNFYDNSPVISSDILFDDLQFNWGQILHNHAKSENEVN